jgi:hypothetical protein
LTRDLARSNDESKDIEVTIDKVMADSVRFPQAGLFATAGLGDRSANGKPNDEAILYYDPTVPIFGKAPTPAIVAKTADATYLWNPARTFVPTNRNAPIIVASDPQRVTNV